MFWWSQRKDNVVVLAWGPQKQPKHSSTHSSSFWKCLDDEWWPVRLPWSVEAQRGPQTPAKAKFFRSHKTLPFSAAMLL